MLDSTKSFMAELAKAALLSAEEGDMGYFVAFIQMTGKPTFWKMIALIAAGIEPNELTKIWSPGGDDKPN